MDNPAALAKSVRDGTDYLRDIPLSDAKVLSQSGQATWSRREMNLWSHLQWRVLRHYMAIYGVTQECATWVSRRSSLQKIPVRS